MKEQNTYEWGEGVFTLLSWFKKDKVKKNEDMGYSLAGVPEFQRDYVNKILKEEK